jgi:hypothetical protein
MVWLTFFRLPAATMARGALVVPLSLFGRRVLSRFARSGSSDRNFIFGIHLSSTFGRERLTTFDGLSPSPMPSFTFQLVPKIDECLSIKFILGYLRTDLIGSDQVRQSA